ncbi:MAG: 4a-hydroxytetrahydrobiopterin dehydratase [Gammaproteobacteria bacterium]
MTTLINSSCEESPKLLNESEINTFLSQISNWNFDKENNKIFNEYQFKNYYSTIAFINAAAWIIHQENHHPDITFGYNKCNIEFSTHSIKGLSKNDFICAAKINQLIFTS